MPRISPQETRSAGLTPKDLGDRLGVSTRSLLNFEKRGLPVAGEGAAKRYPWPAAREWFNEYLQDQAAPDGSELEEARVRKWTAEARRAEYELARTEGSMVAVEDMERLLEDVLQRLRGKLLSLPQKLAPRMVDLASYAQALPILEAEVAEMMDELRLDKAEGELAA
jgi:phage terminase Nu1 subunit (DNA packaging protein)